MDYEYHPADLTELPEKLGEVWQVHAKRIPTSTIDGDDVGGRWCVLAVSATTDSLLPDDLIVSYDLIEQPPTPELLWEKLKRAIVSPRRGNSCRPSNIEFRCGGYRDALSAELRMAGIRPGYNGTLRCWDAVFAFISAGLLLAEIPVSLFGLPGTSWAATRRFFSSAAGFYEQLPFLPDDAAIDVQRDSQPKIRWYGLVHRRFPDQATLTLIEADSPAIRRYSSLPDMLRHSVSLSVSFGGPERMLPCDRRAIESNSWPVASANAYPLPLRTNPGGTFRGPLGWELDLLERALHIIPGMLIVQQRTRLARADADEQGQRLTDDMGHPILTVLIDRRSNDQDSDG